MPQRTATVVDPKTLPGRLVSRMPLLTGDDLEEKRQEILRYFHDTFTLYESLFDCLASDESFYVRANPLRHPLIFYYGHTAVFFINKLNVARWIDQRINATLESILAIGVDEMSWDDLDPAHYDWPTPTEVKAYRDQVRSVVDRFIRQTEFSLPIGWDDPMWVVLMGIEHERIHLETSAVLIRELPLDHVRPHPIWSRICRDTGSAPENVLLPVAGGAKSFWGRAAATGCTGGTTNTVTSRLWSSRFRHPNIWFPISSFSSSSEIRGIRLGTIGPRRDGPGFNSGERPIQFNGWSQATRFDIGRCWR